jgi:Ala-tRNA(Pro) deacylase
MLTCLERLQLLLRERGVEFVLQHHREVFTMQAVAAELHEKGAHVAKVVIAWADGKLVMLVLPTPAHVDFERVRELLNAEVARAAHEPEFKPRFTDCDVGAMPPFGNLYQMPTYLDGSLNRAGEIVIQAGTHRDTIKLATADYVRLAAPIIADFIVRPRLEAAGP